MKTSYMRKMLVLFAAFMLAVSFARGALAEEYTAQTMRLLHYEGEVEILDTSGKSRFVMENARFKSGEAMRTGENSVASVSLDATKIVTMDQKSLVEFIKQANHLLLTIKEGTLLLDVQEKLDENESLDVQTSTMTVGIRGTVIAASEYTLNGVKYSKISVLEGVTQVSYIDGNGVRQSFQLSAGYTAVLADQNGNGWVDAPPEIRKTGKEDTEGFVDAQLQKDAQLSRRVEVAKAYSPGEEKQGRSGSAGFYSADGEWEWSDEVYLVAQSASKIYDGKALTRASDVLVEGLPAEFRCEVYATGSLTNAGKTSNPVGDWQIYNSQNENVTGHFTNVIKKAGQLIVEPAPLTVKTGSAVKTYDGTPLTNPKTEIVVLSGVSVEPDAQTPAAQGGGGASASKNISYLADPSGKNQTLYGVCGVVTVHGTNPLTGKNCEIQLLAGHKLTVFMNSEEGRESLEFLTEPLSVGELPVELLRIYAENPELLKQACKETGWNEEDVKKRIADLKISTNQKLVEQDGVQIAENEADRLLAEFTNVHFSIDSSITNYNGRALGGQEAEFVSVPVDSRIRVTATGSRTNVGTSDNAFEIDWGMAQEENYTVIPQMGKLTVVQAEAAVSTGSSKKVYDGQPLTSSEAAITGLKNGETAQVTAGGEITQVGKTDNIYTIEWGSANKDNYTVRETLGVLEVEPLLLEANLGGKAVVYNGQLEIPSPTITYLNGSHKGESVTGSRTRSLNAQFNFSLFTGDTIRLEITAEELGGGAYALTGSASFPEGSEKNFSLSFTGTAMTVEPRELKITTSSASKPYDGAPLTSAGVTVEGLAEGDTILVTATGSQTEVGSSDNTYTIDWGTVDQENYTVTETLGTLEVTANSTSVVFTAPSAEKTYDGTALTADKATVTGMPAGFTFTATVSGSQTDAGSSDSTVTAYTILSGDGTDVTDSFTDVTVQTGTLTVKKAPVTITTGSAEKTYDGTALTNAEASIAGLVNGETATVTATGSQTEVGSGDNTYTIVWGTANEDNYTVSESLGTLTVTGIGASVVITAPSASKTYDGTTLTAEEATITGLPAGFTFTAAVSGSQRNAGSSESTVTAYTILNSDGEDVTKNFADITTQNGTLTVNKKKVMITTGSASKAYDGTALTCGEVKIEGLVDGETATVTATGSQTEVGSSNNTYTIDWGTTDKNNYTVSKSLGTLTVTENSVPVEEITAMLQEDLLKEYDGEIFSQETTVLWGDIEITGIATSEGSDADEYTPQFTAISFSNGANPDNYSVTVSGMIVINPRTLTAELSEAERTKEYDGEIFSKEVTAVWEDVTITGIVTSEDSDVNEYTPQFTATSFPSGENPDNYSVTVEGTLTITENTSAIVIKAGSATKDYGDGIALTTDEVEWEGLPDDHFAVAEVTGSQTAVGRSYSEITEGTVRIYNGAEEDVTGYFTNVTTEKGTLTVYNPTPITITAHSEKRAYNGYPLPDTTDGPTIDGELPAGYWVEAAQEEKERTDVGETTVNVASYTIWNGDQDVSDFFTNVTLLPGSLTVEARELTVYPPEEVLTKVYDGKGFSLAVTVEGVTAYDVTEMIYGHVTCAETEVGTWPLTFAPDEGSIETAKNYTFTVEGELTITEPAPYDLGYAAGTEAGCSAGMYDRNHGYDQGHSYDDSIEGDVSEEYRSGYENGYEMGYDDGYNQGGYSYGSHSEEWKAGFNDGQAAGESAGLDDQQEHRVEGASYDDSLTGDYSDDYRDGYNNGYRYGYDFGFNFG